MASILRPVDPTPNGVVSYGLIRHRIYVKPPSMDRFLRRELVALPFGGLRSDVAVKAEARTQDKGATVDKAAVGASAERRADRGDIFYEKLIVFKMSHGRAQEMAALDQQTLSSDNLLRKREFDAAKKENVDAAP
ncbi:hypothetical protein DYB37_006727 [Aphanomyces astaci]|uniref:Uncharacterized protein n=1 Tax=Aphanomyces astaci TaxID=112090 RepID=A0A3R7AYT6_APHAT|nr:hypothetical protein DYB35_004762 [Aphanomyces astaci]RHZ22068.1 hypothetical protein DYB37_006727 [Aphanomyces astaci]